MAYNAQLEQLAALLSGGAPQAQVQPVYNQLQAGGQVPLDHPTMMQANPQLAASLLMPQLEQQLAAGNAPAVQELYNLLAQGGEVPLDDPLMLRANPALAQSLAPQQAQGYMPEQAWEMPDTASAPRTTMPQRPMSGGEQAGSAFRGALSSTPLVGGMSLDNMLAGINSVQNSGTNPTMVDNVGGFLYGLFGDSLMPSATPLPQGQAAPQAPAPAAQAPAMQAPQQAPAPMAQPAPMQQPVQQMAQPQSQGRVAQPQDIMAALTGQAPQAQQGNVARPEDIVNALSAQPGLTPEQKSWYQRPEFLTYLGDVLNGVAANPNWAQGIAQGNMYNEQRGITAQKTAQENMLAQAQLAKMMSETQKNTMDAKVAGVTATRENDPNSLANQKTAAEIARIKAEERLAELRGKYLGQEKSFTDNNYAQAYAEILKAEQENMMMDPENPRYLFGADFAARENLNTISEGVARYMPLNGSSMQVLRESQRQYTSGEITKEEFASRLQRIGNVHGPAAVSQFINGASNEQPKPK